MIGLSEASTTLAGILLLSVVTIESGGALLLAIATGRKVSTDIQRRFFRAGHAHAGVFVTLALVCQPFVDATSLDGVLEWLARSGVAVGAILMPAGVLPVRASPGRHPSEPSPDPRPCGRSDARAGRRDLGRRPARRLIGGGRCVAAGHWGGEQPP